ncbi:putative bifunctional diguanylate cyclase/phosphodiesterase [Gracilibacillus kekensis]|uniref:Diguanylate cyclase (GGDEF) domain-containing protein n=1 Tax=Gracilibacillus kekensis TaxID=1027249 RepID=A0A1M7JK41_9BACI|nr:bifunctional diguanylate cyclase/phosphodiesterase [Gracilibacillus kekensis]SHM53479.1 diguanylate cyclase (GGDEF) domain-containing protein [Gracilibacillus kekensis]
MHPEMKSLLFKLLLAGIIYYILLFLTQGYVFLRSIMSIAGPVIAVLIILPWLWSAYQQTSTKQKKFWLFIGIAMTIYMCANVFWIINIVVMNVYAYPTISFVLWLVSYSLFFAAAVHKIRVIETSISTSPYLFNIFVFMVIVVAISIHYLFEPVIFFSHNSVSLTVITIFYQIVYLLLLVSITTLYYLNLYSREKNALYFFIGGLFFQVVAQLLLVVVEMKDLTNFLHFVDALWLFSFLLIGGSAKLATVDSIENDKNRLNTIYSKETYFPYIGALLLIILVSESYNWALNMLSIALSVVFTMIVIRQIIILNHNNKLVRQYRHLAYHDSLTLLKNRTSYTEESQTILKKAEEDNFSVDVLLLDLDRFKNVNDTFGHYAGDHVLKEAANRLKCILNVNCEIYRVGGDEFIILLPHASTENSKNVAETIISTFSTPFSVQQHELLITPSIGISSYPKDALTGELLLTHADAAMYQAKKLGKNRYYCFDENLNEQLQRRMTLEIDLEKAISENQLFLVFQPIHCLNSGNIDKFEALLRWKHPRLGMISPNEFITIAEDTGQINKIGKWVLRKACKETKKLQQNGLNGIGVAVNVSSRQLESSFITIVEEILEKTGLEAKYLELEITESIMQNIDTSVRMIQNFHELGVKIAIDDFGTGYSSLFLLRDLPIDTIKIDKAFIDEINDIKSQSIVKTIIDIGMNLDLRVVAEGIEHDWQKEALNDLQCDFGQGYFFSKPIPSDEIIMNWNRVF